MTFRCDSKAGYLAVMFIEVEEKEKIRQGGGGKKTDKSQKTQKRITNDQNFKLC